MTRDARTNGHASILLRVLQCLSKRGFHVQRQERNTISGRLSNGFLRPATLAKIKLLDMAAGLRQLVRELTADFPCRTEDNLGALQR
jgi:hypothetical protein